MAPSLSSPISVSLPSALPCSPESSGSVHSSWFFISAAGTVLNLNSLGKPFGPPGTGSRTRVKLPFFKSSRRSGGIAMHTSCSPPSSTSSSSLASSLSCSKLAATSAMNFSLSSSGASCSSVSGDFTTSISNESFFG